MTDEEIIEIADKAFDESSFTNTEILRFAKLIAEKERNECARICYDFSDIGYVKEKLILDYHSYLINQRGQK